MGPMLSVELLGQEDHCLAAAKGGMGRYLHELSVEWSLNFYCFNSWAFVQFLGCLKL